MGVYTPTLIRGSPLGFVNLPKTSTNLDFETVIERMGYFTLFTPIISSGFEKSTRDLH